MNFLALAAGLGVGLAPRVPQEQDVIRLKDGTTRAGRVVSEAEEGVVLETLLKGARGQIVGSGKVVIPRASIASVERASEEARLRAEARSKAFLERELRRTEAFGRMRPEPVLVEGIRGFRILGAFFALESTGDLDFVKEMAWYLEEIFGATGRHIGIRRPSAAKVRVYVLNDRDEYVRFQNRRYGGAVLNPAHYNAKENFVVAFNMVHKEEERKLRIEIRRQQGVMESARTLLASETERIRRLAKAVRARVEAAAAEARRSIRLSGDPNGMSRERKVDQWGQEIKDAVRKEEAALQKELEEIRQKCGQDIETARRALEHNERVLVNRNRAMLETLFHEGFHAYAANYLWEGSESAKFPLWLHEGMACYFETSTVEGVELVHGAPHPAFVKVLKEQMARAGLPGLREILKAGPEIFVVEKPSDKDQIDRATAHCAFCWLMAYTWADRMTADRTRAYADEVIGGADPVQAFEKFAGKPLREAEAELRARLRGLP